MKNEETKQHDLVGVVSWGDGCAAVIFFCIFSIYWMHKSGGDEDDLNGRMGRTES